MELCRVFNIRLSPPQLAAVMASFDKDNDGSINCAEFLLQFFLTGFQVTDSERGTQNRAHSNRRMTFMST